MTAAPQTMKILFLGNSHTSVNNVPETVNKILQLDLPGDKITLEVNTGGSLESIAQNQSIYRRIAVGGFSHIVLQGAALSSSHKYKYSQAGAVKLAKAAEKSGAQAILFAEWSRKGWKESDYILNIYKEIALSSGAKIAPVCTVFDRLLADSPKLDLWQADGNHASSLGSYAAAMTLAQAINPAGKLEWRPAGVSQDLVKRIRLAAAKTGRPIRPPNG